MVNILPNRPFEESTNADAFEHGCAPDPSQDGSKNHPGSHPARMAKEYTSKHVLINEGDDADTVYEVIDGTVMLYTISEDGRRTIIGFMQKGDYFGFVMRDAHSYFAQTIGKCVVRSIPRAKLWSEIREHHRTAEKFLALESNALENARKHMVLLTCKTPTERVAMFLLEMARRQGVEGRDTLRVRLPMTRADIGDYTGLVVETVCRCLTHLKINGVIGMDKKGQIDILEAATLRGYASGEEENDLADESVREADIDANNASFDTWTDLVEGLRSGFVAY